VLLFYLPILITILSNVLYHIFIKLTPQDTNPAVALIVTYGTSLLICLAYLFIFPPAGGLVSAFSKTSWVSVALGLSILGLETGFLLAYRAGWDISLAGIVSATAVALVLIPVGLVVFKERLNLFNVFGILLCIIGLILVNYKK
jgi:uncharacterized membrane protein